MAGEIVPQGKDTGRPTTVTAGRLEVSRKERRAIYTENVVATTADLTVTADRMEFDFDEKMETVERMVAIGNVEISRSDGTKATTERATYDVVQERVVLEGRAVAWRRGNMVSGKRITLFLKEDRELVQGDERERVTAVIHPKQPQDQAR
jgi:lipopolysaccharide export system protein LptA